MPVSVQLAQSEKLTKGCTGGRTAQFSFIQTRCTEPWALRGAQVPSLAPPLPSHTASETTDTSSWILPETQRHIRSNQPILECKFHSERQRLITVFLWEKWTMTYMNHIYSGNSRHFFVTMGPGQLEMIWIPWPSYFFPLCFSSLIFRHVFVCNLNITQKQPSVTCTHITLALSA